MFYFFSLAVNAHGSEDTSKWITPHGSTAIKLHGQTIHFLPKHSNCKNAIEFFTHQNLNVSEIVNFPSTIKDLINKFFLMNLKNIIVLL